MNFIYKNWDVFCKKIKQSNFITTSAQQLGNKSKNFIILKHDVETDVEKALRIAKIENNYGICGSYYIQAYLLKDEKNINLLKQIQEMGHEVSYHYDVMDWAKGDIKKAKCEFEKNLKLFENNSFKCNTVCQHGNPLINRVGYTSNRDFFRNESIAEEYSFMPDIMVNFNIFKNVEYNYYSDSGRRFNLIYDPFFNDKIKSDDKNIFYDDLSLLFESLSEKGNIVSMHPHRWESSVFKYKFKTYIFKFVKYIAKIVFKIPFIKNVMSKYYYLAKKI